MHAITCALKMALFHCWQKKACVLILKNSLIIYHKFCFKLWLIGNRTLCRTFWSVIVPMIKEFGLPQRGCLLLLITCMITNQTELHSVLLPSLIEQLLYLPFFSRQFSNTQEYVNPSFHAKVQFPGLSLRFQVAG